MTMDGRQLRKAFDDAWGRGQYQRATDAAVGLALHQRDGALDYQDAGFWLGVASAAAQIATTDPLSEATRKQVV